MAALFVLAVGNLAGCTSQDDGPTPEAQDTSASPTPQGTASESSQPSPTAISTPSESPSAEPTTSATEQPSPTTDLDLGPGLPGQPPPTEPVTELPSAATQLRDEAGCDPTDPTRGVVTLVWIPAPAGGDQLLALTTRKDGFTTGAYFVTDTLASDASTYVISGAQPGGRYYWRVLTRAGGGWQTTAPAEFTGPTCIQTSPAR